MGLATDRHRLARTPGSRRHTTEASQPGKSGCNQKKSVVSSSLWWVVVCLGFVPLSIEQSIPNPPPGDTRTPVPVQPTSGYPALEWQEGDLAPGDASPAGFPTLHPPAVNKTHLCLSAFETSTFLFPYQASVPFTSPTASTQPPTPTFQLQLDTTVQGRACLPPSASRPIIGTSIVAGTSPHAFLAATDV